MAKRMTRWGVGPRIMFPSTLYLVAALVFTALYPDFFRLSLLPKEVAWVAGGILLVAGIPLWAVIQKATVLLVEDLTTPLVGSEQSRRDIQERITARAEKYGVHIVLWDSEGGVVAASGPVPLLRDFPESGSRWHHGDEQNGVVSAIPEGGHVFVASRQHDHSRVVSQFAGVLILLMGTMAVGSYFLARRITRRLEDLQEGVERWGAGALTARVPIQGRDEVAELAESFNEAIERIEKLVKQQKRVLIHVSHELRSPLTRMRMAIELMAEGKELTETDRQKLHRDTVRDIAELDELIGDLLLATRIEGVGAARAMEKVAKVRCYRRPQ